MKTCYEYKKNLKNKTLTWEMIAEALYSMSRRLHNYRCRRARCWSMDQIIDYNERFKSRELRYTHYERVLSTLLEKRGLAGKYCIYEQNTVYKGLKSLMSAQFCRKIMVLICSGDFIVQLDVIDAKAM